MPKIVFAAIAPHPPVILPSVGSEKDRNKVKNTISALEKLGEKLAEEKPNTIIISSPHPDWGFNVPLYFLAKNFRGEIKTYMMGMEEPNSYFEQGKKVYQSLGDKKYALIASGDLSHCLKEEGPYGFHAQGPKFDKALVEYLEKKNIKNILKLNEHFPKAGECGLRSFCFLLGILESAGIDWKAEILSYEGPFGVGYLTTNFKVE